MRSKIETFLSEPKSGKDLGEYIFALFTESFGADIFQHPMDECCIIAREIIGTAKFKQKALMVVTTSGKQKAASQESDRNNKRRAGLFGNTGKDFFSFLLRD